jgi:hypothetical protein
MIVSQNKYNQKDFETKLHVSDGLVKQTVNILSKKYSSNKYEIISSFDNHPMGMIELPYNFKEKLRIIYKNRYVSDEKIDEEINKIIRSHDIAIINKQNNKIELLVECKDFGQLIYFPGKTGLPKFYLEKLNLIKEYFEEIQQNKIIQLCVFRDNIDIINIRKNKNIDITTIFQNNNNQFLPYFGVFNDDILNREVAINGYGKIIPSNFVRSSSIIHKKEINKNAKEQILWNYDELDFLYKLNTFELSKIQEQEKKKRKNNYIKI